MSQFHVEPGELTAYADYLSQVAGHFDSITGYAHAEGCSTAGFTGLLTLLRPAVGVVGDLYGATLAFGRDRMEGTAEGLERTALDYATTDEANAASLPALAAS
ncbi:MAG TPA: hypothetical protein VGD67_07390 [Pseudonocardiaceae bacterium]